MPPFIASSIKGLTSLRFTVVLIVFSVLLVVVATLDQVNVGLLGIQEKYLRTFVVFSRVPGTSVTVPVFPGGYLIGGLLLLNLIAVHIYRFRLTWKKAGMLLTHAGLILLLVGELLTGLWQRESLLQLREGETRSYSEDSYRNELVLINMSKATTDRVISVPETLVGSRGVIRHPALPFDLHVLKYGVNAELQAVRASSHGAASMPNLATRGAGTNITMRPTAPVHSSDARNAPAALIEIFSNEKSLGTWLVSTALEASQTFTFQNQIWEIALRPKRYYVPFSVTLLRITHETYPGSDIPKNFASRVRVRSDDHHDDREVTIFMNNPLRYRGLTYYQHQMNKAEGFTGLQVVRNPSWALPYISSSMMGLGLLMQFGLHLFGFVCRRQTATPAALAT